MLNMLTNQQYASFSTRRRTYAHIQTYSEYHPRTPLINPNIKKKRRRRILGPTSNPPRPKNGGHAPQAVGPPKGKMAAGTIGRRSKELERKNLKISEKIRGPTDGFFSGRPEVFENEDCVCVCLQKKIENEDFVCVCLQQRSKK